MTDGDEVRKLREAVEQAGTTEPGMPGHPNCEHESPQQGPNRAQRRAAEKAGKKASRGVSTEGAVVMLAGQVQLLQRQLEETHASRVRFAEVIGKVVQSARPLIDALDAAFPDVEAMEDRVLADAIKQHRRVVLGLLEPAELTPEEEAARAADGAEHVVVPAGRSNSGG